MSIANKLKAAKRAAKMSVSVACNTGIMPADFLSIVTIEPTSVCNLSCPLCPTGTGSLRRKNKFISMEHFDRIIELTKSHVQGFVLNIFGEPTFHPQFREMLEKTRPYPTWLSTNLSYDSFSARMLAEFDHLHVICSVDTVNADEYTDYRVGGNYQNLLKNLDILSDGECRVYPQFLVAEPEYDEEQYIAFAREHGVPVEDMIIKEKLAHYRLDPTDKPVPGVCHSCYTEINFNCDGYLVPCCNNVREELYIRHIDEISCFSELLRGADVKRVRKALARDKNQFASCGRCAGSNYWRKNFRGYLETLKLLMLRKTSHRSRMIEMHF